MFALPRRVHYGATSCDETGTEMYRELLQLKI